MPENVGPQDEHSSLCERIAELEALNAKLQDSEQRLLILFEHAPDAYYLSTHKGTLIDGNIAAEEITGYTRDELIGESFLHLNLLSPHDLPKAAALLAKNVAGQPTGPEEFLLNRKDGTQVPVEISTQPVKIGGCPLILGLARDITERKREEMAVSKSEERLRKSQAIAQVGSWEIDLRTHELHWTDETYRIFGIPADKPLVYEEFLSLVHPLDRESVDAAWNRALEGDDYDIEHRIVVADEVKWVREKADVTFNRSGSPLSLQGIVQDITERKQAERALQINERRLMIAQDVAGIGNWELNLATGSIWGSANTFKIFGIELDLNENPEQLLPLDRIENCIIEREQVHQALASLIENNSEYDVEYNLIREIDGHEITIHSVAKQIRDDAGVLQTIMGTIQDITERKRTEMALRKSEQQYRLLATNTSDVVWTASLDGRFTYVSPSVEQLRGYTPEEVMNQPFSAALTPESLKIITISLARLQQLVAQGEPFTLEETHELEQLCKDGSTVWTETATSTIHNDNGTLLGILGVSRNITERKQEEEKQREHYKNIEWLSKSVIELINFPADENIYQYIGDQIAELAGESIIAINSINEAGDILTNRAIVGLGTISAQVANLMGSPPKGMSFNPQDEELLYLIDRKLHDSHKSLYAILQKAVPKPICSALEKLVNIGKIYTMGFASENRLLGTAVIFLSKGHVLRAPEFIETFINQASITLQRKRAEEALEAERGRAQTYLDVAAVAMIALDREGHITLANRQGAAMLGYSEQELLGKDWFDTCVPDRLRNTVRDVFQELMAGTVDPVDHYENPILTRDGEERIVAWHNALLHDREGKIIGTLSSGQDITDRMKAEEDKLAMEAQLRQSQKLESIGTLASGVAHEINNPLMGMINYAELVKDKVQDPKAIEYLKGIGDEGNRIAKIVRNLLFFSRQDKEKHSPAQLADIIESSLSLVGSLLRKDQITLDLDIPEDLPQVKCRNQQIQQVVINLLTNARDALNKRYPEYDEDKLIRITARSFERDGENWIRTTVEDHGSGIPEDVAGRIFDPFFTTKPRGEGTGLGLSVSFGIIREHHGEMTIESVPDNYTRFHMDLRVNNGWSHKKSQC